MNLNPLQNKYTTFLYFLVVKILDHTSTMFAVKPMGWENELNIFISYTKGFINPEITLTLVTLTVPFLASMYREKFSTTVEGIALILPFVVAGNYLQGMGYALGILVSLTGFILSLIVVFYSIHNDGLWISNDENWLVGEDGVSESVSWM